MQIKYEDRKDVPLVVAQEIDVWLVKAKFAF